MYLLCSINFFESNISRFSIQFYLSQRLFLKYSYLFCFLLQRKWAQVPRRCISGTFLNFLIISLTNQSLYFEIYWLAEIFWRKTTIIIWCEHYLMQYCTLQKRKILFCKKKGFPIYNFKVSWFLVICGKFFAFFFEIAVTSKNERFVIRRMRGLCLKIEPFWVRKWCFWGDLSYKKLQHQPREDFWFRFRKLKISTHRFKCCSIISDEFWLKGWCNIFYMKGTPKNIFFLVWKTQSSHTDHAFREMKHENFR